MKALYYYNTLNEIKGINMLREEDIKSYRIDLDMYQLHILKKYINTLEVSEEDVIMFNEIKEKVNNPKKIKRSVKKLMATDKATEARTAKAKEKIQNAINILRMENKKITHYSIAKQAEVSYLTVKKYISLDEIN